jgi:hypothetical protein
VVWEVLVRKNLIRSRAPLGGNTIVPNHSTFRNSTAAAQVLDVKGVWR